MRDRLLPRRQYLCSIQNKRELEYTYRAVFISLSWYVVHTFVYEAFLIILLNERRDAAPVVR